MTKARRVGPEQRSAFASICDDTRTGFSQVIDLILIHNERRVSGPQPRTTLNPLIATLSVAVWERFVADIGHLARSVSSEAVRPGEVDSQGFSRLGDDKHGGRSAAVSTLAAASGQLLPDRWRIRLVTGSPGKGLRFGYTAEGLDPWLVELVDWWVNVRNKVVHRGLPQLLHWLVATDAADGGRTINTTTARQAFTMFLQLIDQTIRTISEVAEFARPHELYLPEDWLTGNLVPQRSVTDPEQLRLWHGRSLLVAE